MNKRSTVNGLLLVGMSLSLSLGAEFARSKNVPEFPAINNEAKIQAIDDQENLTGPLLPSHRTTNDGRIAIPLTGRAYVYLNVPENLNEPFVNSAAGTEIVARDASGEVDRLTFYNNQILGGAGGHPAGFQVGMRTICDATAQFSSQQWDDSDPNPHSCGSPSSPVDCYDFHVVTSRKVPLGNNDIQVQMRSREMRVRVANPKTPSASLISQEWIGDTKPGLTFTLPDSWHLRASVVAEPVFTGDGRFLITRIGHSQLAWNRNGTPEQGRYDIVYSAIPEGAAPCDVGALSEFKPISHAPYDLEVNARYGFASRPFRDPEGNLIPDGENLRATYPWVDRAGDNIMMESVNAKLYNVVSSGGSQEVVTRFPTRCADGSTSLCRLNPSVADVNGNGIVEWQGLKRGVTLLGKWTAGKMVLLDGMLNNSDFGFGFEYMKQRQIQLYQAGTGPTGTESAWVNAGVAMHTQIPQSSLPDKFGMDVNLNFIDSIENIFSYRQSFKPVSFRDVVWLVTGGRTTAEVELDDYIDSRAYIVSNMTPSQTHSNAKYRMDYWDGYNFSTGDFTAEKRVQNAATTPVETFPTPAYGVVRGDARIEPIAMGGIEGKGLFLEPGDAIDYHIPTAVNQHEWVVSLFIDPRFQNDGTARRLITFPDGTEVDLVGRDTLRLNKANTTFTVDLPGSGLVSKAWNHIGFLADNYGQRVSVFIDGYRTHVWNGNSSDARMFKMAGNTLSLGNNGEIGIRGWIDDFKVFAHGGNPEYMCNLAKGTIVGLPSDSDAEWLAVSNRYANEHHSGMASALSGPDFDHYACFHDYSGGQQAYRNNLPTGSVAVGSQFLFPEGPIIVGVPRPDSSTNPFCLTCHADGNAAGLGVEALTQQSSHTLEEDMRRQPLQPLRMVYGHIPANFFSQNAPESPITDLPAHQGVNTDQYLFPAAQDTTGPDVGTGFIGDEIWIDANEDGINDDGSDPNAALIEIGLGGVQVNLQDCNNNNVEIDNTQSNPDGSYGFNNVPNGLFRLEFVKPAGYDFTLYKNQSALQRNSDVDPTTGLTSCYPMDDSIQVAYRAGVDAGFKPEVTGNFFVGDRVWEDLPDTSSGVTSPANGKMDAGEVGLGGVQIRLRDCISDALVSTTLSNADGSYGFPAVPAGQFRLQFVEPGGYDFTVLRAPGVEGQSNSDADPESGLTHCFDMSDSYPHRGGLDAGFKPET